MNRNRRLGVGVLFASMFAACTSSPVIDVSGEDLAAMRRASRAYAEAWLSNDPEAVMATLVPEPVLSPSGLAFLEGQAAAREFWWPEGSPPTKVTRFEYEEIEAGASGDIGYVRGTFTLGFEYDGTPYTNVGKFLHILRRTEGGGWRISHHLWDDLPGGA